MKLKSIIEKTNFSLVTPFSTEQLIESVSSDFDILIVSLVTAEIKVTSAMFKMAANNDLIGLLKLIPNVTEQMAADIIDGSMIGFNLQEGLFDEAIDAVKDLKLELGIKLN